MLIILFSFYEVFLDEFSWFLWSSYIGQKTMFVVKRDFKLHL